MSSHDSSLEFLHTCQCYRNYCLEIRHNGNLDVELYISACEIYLSLAPVANT
jgi:hypothetical protein